MMRLSPHWKRMNAGGQPGFSMVELLAVVAIMITMAALCLPAVISVGSGNNFVGALYEIRGILMQARAYAIANNTHVFVGIEEVDASLNSSAKSQSVSTSKAGGRIAIAVVASRNGTKNYEFGALDDWAKSYGRGEKLTIIGKLRRFENLHLLDMGTTAASGNMVRTMPTSEEYILANAACVSKTPFAYPIGVALTDGQYQFSKVIEFDPHGEAKIIISDRSVNIPKVIEIGLQPTHGSAIPAAPANFSAGHIAAIQINGINGAVTIYRP